jgi:hypothetical protein
MSWRVVQLVFDAAPVRDTPLVLLLALAEWSQDDGVSWHPVEHIAARVRCSERRTRELLLALASPDQHGDRLLTVRRAKRTTFYEINLDLLKRLNAERNGQGTLWEDTVDKPEEKQLKNCESPVDDEPPVRTESASQRQKSASQRVPTINNRNNRKEPENQKTDQPPPLVVEIESVLWIMKKLASGTAFPSAPGGLNDRQLDARQRFLDAQRRELKKAERAKRQSA